MMENLSLDARTYFDIALRYQEQLREAQARLIRLSNKLVEIHDITQDRNVSAQDKVDNIAATASSALFWREPRK